jgi:predicted 3-demethylubiquinone-9 3-methyltransferase (glyoxalase superfamily)
MAITQRITTFLWFDDQAEQAAELYTSVFADSGIDHVARYGETGPGPKGQAMTVKFRLEGQEFLALNGGPVHKFTEAVSLLINCDTQDEVDRYWRLLSDGGSEDQCGWLKDRYGLSWQVVPTALPRLLTDPDPQKAARVMRAMLRMRKIDIATLEKA